MIATAATRPQDETAQAQFPIAVFLTMPLLWLVMMGGFVVMLILGIIYCLKARRGEWAPYSVIGAWAARIVKPRSQRKSPSGCYPDGL